MTPELELLLALSPGLLFAFVCFVQTVKDERDARKEAK